MSLTISICLLLFFSFLIDDQTGIDQLLDWVDELDLDHASNFADDEWSQPASSIMGCVDESLLFEL